MECNGSKQETNPAVKEVAVQHEELDFSHRVKDGILDSIYKLRHREEHTDFIVIVDNTEIRCHRFMLCACSNYFARLLGHGQIENNTITFTSFSKATFETIVEALYTGMDVVTSDNVINVWLACHELEVSFMVDVCEEFILKHLTVQNTGEIHRNALITGSEKILQATFKMMLKHFDVFKECDDFLELTFDTLLKLIDSPDLQANTEDTVVDAILKWFKHHPSLHLTESTPINRKECLGKLLSAARLALVSPDCIKMLMTCAVVEDREAKEALDRAIIYQLRCGQRHGQWPSSALHRKNSPLGNMVVAGYADGRISVLSVADLKRWHHLKAFPEFSTSYITLTAFDNTFYAFASPRTCCLFQPKKYFGIRLKNLGISYLQNSANLHINACGQLFVLKESEWQKVTDVSGTEHILVPHGESIYFFHPVTMKVQKLDLPFNGTAAVPLRSVPANGLIGSAFAFEKSILVFCQEWENSTETTVCCLDTVRKTWSKLNNLQGQAEIFSFRNDKNTYILQDSGAVHEIINTPSGQESFRFIGKLWHYGWQICGCVSVRNTLFICGSVVHLDFAGSTPEKSTEESDEVKFMSIGKKCLNGVFDSIQYISGRFDNTPCSGIISGNFNYFQPVILNKNIIFR